jgi:hypothetical protein
MGRLGEQTKGSLQNRRDKKMIISPAMRSRTNRSVSADPETQFRDAFKFVGLHLEAAGLKFGDVVDATTAQHLAIELDLDHNE